MSEINMKESKVFNDFKSILSTGNSSQKEIDEFIKIMELPDEIFDRAFASTMERLEKIYNNPAYEKELLEALKNEIQRNPDFDINEEEKATKEFIKEIENEEISDNKKKFLIKILEGSVLKFVEIYNNPREKISVKIQKVNENATIPTYAHPSDAGADISSCETITVKPGETVLVDTGLKVAIPKGYEISLRPRSGFSLKTGMRIANSPATIDSAYRGVIKVIMWNSGTNDYTINTGDKIAQMLINPVPMINFIEAEVNDETDRGTGGFGSTGS